MSNQKPSQRRQSGSSGFVQRRSKRSAPPKKGSGSSGNSDPKPQQQQPPQKPNTSGDRRRIKRSGGKASAFVPVSASDLREAGPLTRSQRRRKEDREKAAAAEQQSSGSTSTDFEYSKESSPSSDLPAHLSKSEMAAATCVLASPAYGPEQQTVEIKYADVKVVGNGSFGVVYLARLTDSNEKVAIKKVLQDKRFKNRELQIMRKLEHQNVVKLKYYFFSQGEPGKDEVYLNLILEFIPETVYRVARHYSRQRLPIPMIYVKLYIYQVFRALAYIHDIGVCHRDIKPQNLLIDPESGILKLCDFGSAKFLVRGEPNVSYICSRYYRAPELIFGATNYTNSIDVWSVGTVMAELMLGHPIFPGDSGVDQLVEIIKVLGTPTREQIQQMNPNYKEFRFPSIKSHPWNRVFRQNTPADAIDLITRVLEYTPTSRPLPLEACAHPFFDELRQPTARLPSGRQLPSVLTFTDQELRIAPHLNATLIPGYGNADPTQSTTQSATGTFSISQNDVARTSNGSGAPHE
ncbi:hypothetical protein L596_008973 [Steinernema carpocapsae]|uniref:Glycogen synthase kinase-3 n=1 Tax=Steinernema carpocapsae TaxID=34508 RepID=A0A4U5PE72_STECR|nr:hypothetical protein L596_008973 [Steinernema carpocapsae]